MNISVRTISGMDISFFGTEELRRLMKEIEEELKSREEKSERLLPIDLFAKQARRDIHCPNCGSHDYRTNVQAGHGFDCSGSHMAMVLSGSRQGFRKGPIAKPILTGSLPTFLNHRFGRNIIVFSKNLLNSKQKHHPTAPLVGRKKTDSKP